jgi:predicted RNase H-like nuclease (RuvC/YqgF family)
MPEEEKKQGKQDSSPASGEKNPEDQNQDQDQGQKSQNQDQGTGNADQTAELMEAQKRLQEQNEKLAKQLDQAGYTIQKLKEKMKEAGIEMEEERGLSMEQVQELLKKNTEELSQKFGQQFSELLRSIRAWQKPSQPSGGGQKLPKQKESPLTPEEHQHLISRGFKWDPEKGLYIGKSGRAYDPKDMSDVAK